jgi:A/G-specific adenine glycosylase
MTREGPPKQNHSSFMHEPQSEVKLSPAIVFFREQLLAWAEVFGRGFPWRETPDPYHILIAEMMLRRTRAQQVVPVYLAFLEQFPTVEDLAAADEDEVARLLWPLGLAWRAANFHRMARQVIELEGGQIPRERPRLLALTGVGDYVASAVRCVGFGEPDILVDTNTVRVAGRYLGFPTHAESRRNPTVRAAVAQLIDPATARAGNLALLDFAALICRAPEPLCERCPMTAHCEWFRANRQPRELAAGES